MKCMKIHEIVIYIEASIWYNNKNIRKYLSENSNRIITIIKEEHTVCGIGFY